MNVRAACQGDGASLENQLSEFETVRRVRNDLSEGSTRGCGATVSANGTRNISLLHINVFSSSMKRHSNPDAASFSTVVDKILRPAEETLSRAKGERQTIWPGATRSVSTATVAGTTLL
jgi:hypothetical protein